MAYEKNAGAQTTYLPAIDNGLLKGSKQMPKIYGNEPAIHSNPG
jgi:hypothetical protein